MQVFAKTEADNVKRPHRGLDRLDIRLLREILQGPVTLTLNIDFRKSFRTIARIMKIDEDTVRARLRRLGQIGFIRGWRVLLNPNVTGTIESVVWFDVPVSVSKEDLIVQLRLVPGVFLIANFYGSFLGVIFRQEGGELVKRTISLIQALSKASTISNAYTPWPKCRTDLSTIDWMILASLHRNPRKPFVAVSGETGISTRTVQRRLQKMASDGALFPLCSINPKALDGTILANLGVGYEKRDGLDVCRSVALELDECIWYIYQTIPANENELNYCWFNLALPNLSKAHEISDRVKRIAGVKHVRIEFYEDHILLFDAIDEQLRRKLPSNMTPLAVP